MRKWIAGVAGMVVATVLAGLILSQATSIGFWQGVWGVIVWLWRMVWLRVPIPLWALVIVAYALVRVGIKWVGHALPLPEESIRKTCLEMAEPQLGIRDWRILGILVEEDGRAIYPHQLEEPLRCRGLLVSSHIDKLKKLGLVEECEDSMGAACISLTKMGRDFALDKGYVSGDDETQ